ncbi:MAG: ergothioneine biosynthesis protein EgtB [Myxococcales bacterium]|nr:ergothioneine biosynthesis protein EgtB [Myxococcales bacterium]
MQRQDLLDAYARTRDRTERLAWPLSPEDQGLQAFPDASPIRWHRAHTTWFFETFVLGPRGVEAHEPAWGVLFNSYYEAVGPRHARPERGLLSRPSTTEVGAWRQVVDERMTELLSTLDEDALAAVTPLVLLGLAHEQQHQELMLTDIVAAFARHPLAPVMLDLPDLPPVEPPGEGWIEHAGGQVRVGHEGPGFAFDNEGPAHDTWLAPFALQRRLVTVGEWAAFARDGGYATPSLWLSDGIARVRSEGWEAPAYTRLEGESVVVFGPHGEREASPDEPALHLSFYEADALATWLGGRLPTEVEWEVAFAGATDEPWRDERLIPAQSASPFGTAWQWTRSAYEPYPGYRPAAGAVGEYNGKFMVDQQVLRGSSVFTPPGHSRPTYRNFWPARTRFQATGLRLARDLR